ncbi:hypothetical protein BKA70DRAFT_1557667 [Coprinopsis sp. MPI-PUGE-AT-0042]|nr:hypothetical protein BKA70DRAFT_1557667 [Coprinopsis sp. MPI-PUGE-AT-0042]
MEMLSVQLNAGHPSAAIKAERRSPSLAPQVHVEGVDETVEGDRDIEMKDEDDGNEDEDEEDETIDPDVFKVRGALNLYTVDQLSTKELHVELLIQIHRTNERLTSISQFREGKIPHRDTTTNKSWYYTLPDGKKSKGKLLPESAMQLFDEKRFTVIDYHHMSPQDERNLFERVQLGVPLTAGETTRYQHPKDNVCTSFTLFRLLQFVQHASSWISDLEQKHVAIKSGIGEYINTQHSRGKDFQNLAQMVYFCEGIDNGIERNPPHQAALTEWLAKTEDPFSKPFMDKMEEMLLELRNIASDKKYNEGFIELQKSKQVFAPIEFVFIGILLYRIAHEYKTTKANALCAIISAIRESFLDVRANSKVVKALWNYCNQLVKDPNGQVTLVHMVLAVSET